MYQVNTWRANRDGDCESGIAPDCLGEVTEGDMAGYVDDDVACTSCVEHAQSRNADDLQSRASRIKFRGRN